jgi:hypothetical protein
MAAATPETKQAGGDRAPPATTPEEESPMQDQPNHPNVSEAEAFELFQGGDSVLTELGDIETLDALVAEVREMTQDEAGARPARQCACNGRGQGSHGLGEG